jgi:diaminohydroxyphosphoribosylaminopyrimidine deaminase / 5-amino-6-(5-phosphoribosylamino)uracil reductase
MSGRDDWRWMELAIELAWRCPPSAEAYSVGAVIVGADGAEIARGFSREGDDPHVHAEEAALGKLVPGDPRLDGATIYSTLEPCSWRKSRPRSCTELILATRASGMAGTETAETAGTETAGTETAGTETAGTGTAGTAGTGSATSGIAPGGRGGTGLARVVIAWREPSLFVADCQGAELLAQAGVAVLELPELASLARAPNRHLDL